MLRGLSAVAVILFSSMIASCMAQTTSPKVHLELQIAADDVTELRQLITDFAKDEGFAFEDVGPELPPRQGREVFYILLKRSDIEVLVDDFLEQYRFGVAIYDLKSRPEFESVAARLEAMLRNRWPDRLRPYTGE